VHFEKPRCTWEVGPVETHTTPGKPGSASTATWRAFIDGDFEMSGTCALYSTQHANKPLVYLEPNGPRATKRPEAGLLT
jgi:hypothetical protein